jgi:hypothetical protein
VLPLHPSIVLPTGTRRDFRSGICRIRITLAITRPRIFLAEEGNLAEAAQVNGGVS